MLHAALPMRYNLIEMSNATEHLDILQRISTWPPEQKVSLANEILDSVGGDKRILHPKRDTLARALGLARLDGAPPSDDEVDTMLEELRLERYSKC